MLLPSLRSTWPFRSTGTYRLTFSLLPVSCTSAVRITLLTSLSASAAASPCAVVTSRSAVPRKCAPSSLVTLFTMLSITLTCPSDLMIRLSTAPPRSCSVPPVSTVTLPYRPPVMVTLASPAMISSLTRFPSTAVMLFAALWMVRGFETF